MSAAEAITQLSSLVRDVETWIRELIDTQCTEDEISALDVVGRKLTDAAAYVQKKTGSFRPTQTLVEEKTWAASEELRSQARSTVESLAKGNKLSRQVVFCRNIELIFTGPKDKVRDSNDIKARKTLTRRRCEKIRKLSPAGIVVWAASYEPTLWAAGQMAKDMFECLLCSIGPISAQSISSEIQDILQELQAEDALRNSHEYSEFVNAFQEARKHEMISSSETHAGRTLTWDSESSDNAQNLYSGMAPTFIIPPTFYLPLDFDKYSGLLTNQLENVCSYLPTAIKTSCLWNNGGTTQAFGLAFPSNPLEDAIAVISMSQAAGSQLLQFTGPITTTSSLHGQHIQQEY